MNTHSNMVSHYSSQILRNMKSKCSLLWGLLCRLRKSTSWIWVLHDIHGDDKVCCKGSKWIVRYLSRCNSSKFPWNDPLSRATQTGLHLFVLTFHWNAISKKTEFLVFWPGAFASCSNPNVLFDTPLKHLGRAFYPWKGRNAVFLC